MPGARIQAISLFFMELTDENLCRAALPWTRSRLETGDIKWFFGIGLIRLPGRAR